MSTHAGILTLESATDFSTERLTRVLNQAYADYLLPVWFHAYQFEQMCEDMDVDLSRSVVAVASGKLVGLALLSVREEEGWISGVGVTPAWRRRGLGRAIIQRLQETAYQDKLTRLRLEVLHKNVGGRRLYAQTGFRELRDLLVLRLDPSPRLPSYQPVRLAKARPQALLNHYSRFHNGQSSWQRDFHSLRRRCDRIQGVGLQVHRSTAGYALYQIQPGVCHILDLALDPALDGYVELARRMLLTLHSQYPKLGGYVVNVPDADPHLPVFLDAGYTVRYRQTEMLWRVPQMPQKD